MAYTNSWDESTPAGTENAATTDDYLRKHRLDLGERLESMLYGFNTSDGTDEEGEYGVKHLKLYPQTTPTYDTDYGFLYSKTVSGARELHYLDSANNEVQITSGGIAVLGHVLTATSDATLAAANLRGNTTYTNKDASDVVTITLPAGAANYKVSFIVQTAKVLRIQPNGNEVFIDFTGSSTATKYIYASTVGTALTIVWDGAKWQITDITGIWDEEA